MSLGAGARKIGRAIQAAVGHGGGTLYLLQVKIKFRLKFFNQGWFPVSFVSN